MVIKSNSKPVAKDIIPSNLWPLKKAVSLVVEVLRRENRNSIDVEMRKMPRKYGNMSSEVRIENYGAGYSARIELVPERSGE
jgi:hypothetical protein